MLPCCTIEFIKSFLFWVVLVAYNIGIYICIYIYKSQLYSLFFVIFNCNVFVHCMRNNLRYEKIFCKLNESITSQHNPSSDVIFLGVHSESIFPFMEYLFSQKCFLQSSCLLLIAEPVSLDTTGKPTVRFILKIIPPS